MRVISGMARGHKLYAPSGLETRPTADRIKETLFNIISRDLQDCVFLDLFSGTGAIGIEALSRGAKKACFVDISNDSVKCIKRNLVKTRLIDKAEIMRSDANVAIKKLSFKTEKFDIIFLDPPYSKKDFNIDAIASYGILDKNGYVIAEQDNALVETKIFKTEKIKEYKTTKLVFLRPPH